MSARLLGIVSVLPTRDKDGYRVWKVKYKVETTDADMFTACYNAALCPGLPDYGAYCPVDADAYCRWDFSVSPVGGYSDQRVNFWYVEKNFSSKPDQSKSCKDHPTDDPLLEPNKISGTFTKEKEEAVKDRFGAPVVNSAFEQINGPKNEWDVNRPTIKIEQNVADLQLPLLCALQNTLNQYPLWGCPVRSIKLGVTPWDRKFYGNCYKYYVRTLEFEVRAKYDEKTHQVVGDWDRDITDEGTRVLAGAWGKKGTADEGHWVVKQVNGVDVDNRNPMNFIRMIDPQGNPIKTLLDGAGRPFDPSYLKLQPPCSVSCQPALGGSLDVSKSYRYVVTAINAAGETTPSGEGWAEANDGNAAFNANSILVSWKSTNAAQAGANSFMVYRASGDNNFFFVQRIDSGYQANGQYTWTDTGATSGVAHPPTTNTATTTFRPNPGVRTVSRYPSSDFASLLQLPLDF